MVDDGGDGGWRSRLPRRQFVEDKDRHLSGRAKGVVVSGHTSGIIVDNVVVEASSCLAFSRTVMCPS